jgi:hypothetical protein
MRELEFLPAWYPQLRGRRRMVMLVAWLGMMVIGSLAAWSAVLQREMHVEQTQVQSGQRRLVASHQQIRELEKLQEMQRQWRQQAEILNQLGVHIEAARVMNAIEAVMPREVALVSLAMATESQARSAPNLAAARSAQAGGANVDRRMQVRMVGVAPTDVDVANFLAKLGALPFLEGVSLNYAKERPENGHLMREFEVTFSLDLNAPAGG